MKAKWANLIYVLGLLSFVVLITIVLFMADRTEPRSPDTVSIRQAQDVVEDLRGEAEPVETSSIPLSVPTDEVAADDGIPTLSIDPVATQDAILGIIYTPTPTHTPAPPPTATPLPTEDPVILACVATVEALPGYPTVGPHINPFTEAQETAQSVVYAESYLLTNLPGVVIATGKQSSSATPTLYRYDLESYQVVEVALPCEMSFRHLGWHSNRVQKLWRVEVKVKGNLYQGAMRYETCVDGTPLPGGMTFDHTVLREGATISFGYGFCDAEFSEKLHFKSGP